MSLELTEVLSESFDIIRGLLIGEGATFKLLREIGESQPYEEIRDVETGWRSRYSEFFGNTTFDVADVTSDLAADVDAATHLVVLGATIAGMNDMIYELLPDTAAPDSDHPFWRIRAKSTGRRYTGSGEEA